MIPQFPEFKKLELSDKDQIESFTKKFPPYSDFNFVSMWCWDIKGDMRVSLLNNNLVVRFNDYITGNPFYSFLGSDKSTETAEALIEYSNLFGGGVELKLLPEVAVKNLDNKKFLIQEDRDQFDYIFEIPHLAELAGSKCAKKRNYISALKRNNTLEIKILDLSNPETKFEIKKINLEWLEQKKKNDPYFEMKNELMATDRFFEGDFNNAIVAMGIFIDEVLSGYTVTEYATDDYAISHFTKADMAYHGIYDCLLQENAIFLQEKGYKFLNYEQDLGLDGLRKSKETFSTGIFLKQYKIMLL